MQDASGLVLPQASFVTRGPQYRIVGTVTFLCHTCGDLITRPWEVFFVDDDWASELEPPRVTRSTTTHHVGHLAG